MKLFLSLIALSLLLSSCVGTVEDKNPKLSKSAATGGEEIMFSGVNEVIPVSDDKVEVYFYPASGNVSDMTYQIFVNNTKVPIEVKGESLQLNQYGQYMYTVTGLKVFTQYSFSVGVRNAKENTESNSNKALFATTFPNYTADFGGVSKVYHSSGDLGKEQIEVEWVPAVSLGSSFSPKPNDPVAYEIRYMQADEGKPTDLLNPNHPAVKVSMKPTTLGSNPQLSQERKRSIPGLSPGKKYYVLVRAIHKAYVDYKTEPGYKTEQNNKILSVTTLSDSGLFDWDAASVKYETPIGEEALSRIDLRWDGALGPFKNYRVYYIKVGEATETYEDVAAKPDTLDSTTIDALNGTDDYQVAAADALSYQITGLSSYAYYKATVVACVTSGCADGSRIIGEEVFFRVTPKLAPFSGLLEIQDPTDINKLDEIEVKFDPPVTTAGYVNKFELYCFDNFDDNNPDELLYNIASTSSKPSCAGLTRITASPSDFSSYSSYSKIKIKGSFFGPNDVVSDKTYCFGAVPVIEGTNFVNRNLNSAIIRCKVVKIKVPTKEEFPGPANTCTVGADNISVTWDEPESGIYNRYEVFWKEDDGTPFSFQDAVNGLYNSQDNLTTLNFTINTLLPGKKYQYGVLTYVAGANKKYSEFNTGIRTCQIPLPTPKFGEWVDIFAVGPKANGLVPRRDNSAHGFEKAYLFETLNDNGQPIEVPVENYAGNNYSPTTEFENQFASVSSSVNFPGVYGKAQGDPDGIYMNQYSNSGIVRIAWKDITFNSNTKTMTDFVGTYETAALKKDRKYGYKVYRSDNGQKTWTELTSSSFAFQTPFNAGLLHAVDYAEAPRATDDAITPIKAVMFTDYSVKHAGLDGNSARARVYYYKVVPVFNGEELRYERENTNPQHIIKVTLPPENMALVHRLMANRQTCNEIGKSYSKDVSQHYTCTWNGVGARGLAVPWVPGATVYDFGSDLLIDRFELGCNFTRGDYQNINSAYSGPLSGFLGDSSGGGTFKGCLFKQGSLAQTNGGSTPADGDTYTDRATYRVGDCIGESFSQVYNETSICPDITKANYDYLMVPGIVNGLGLNQCQNPSNLLPNISDTYNNSFLTDESAQSEYGAVFYNRDFYSTSENYGLTSIRGGGANPGNPHRLRMNNQGRYPSRCMINIPVADNSPGGNALIKQRWIPANMLTDLVYDGLTNNKIDIATVPMSVVESMTQLFDSTFNSVPNAGYRANSALYRYDENSTPVARIVSSNDAKLPPINGLNHDQADAFCSTYTVEVGSLNDSTNTFSVEEGGLNKRMMRRTEGIVASAYPKTFSLTDINNLERGVRTETGTGASAILYNASCNAFSRSILNGQTHNEIEAGLGISVRFGDLQNKRHTNDGAIIFSGSSFFDHEGSDYSTQSCVSRYGLQDIVGNMREYSSERIFCNYDGEEFKIGTSYQSADSIEFNNGDLFNASSFTPWVQSSPDTGRCSLVEAGGARGATFTAGSYMVPQYDMFGNLNSAMITATNTIDEYSISYLRNGDGFYLDFGQDNLAPPLSINDTLALTDEYPVTTRKRDVGVDPRRGKYFSPIAGIPLECANGTCLNSTDNLTISTTGLQAKIGAPDTDFVVPHFPITNSMIISDGMSEITQSGSTTISATNSVSYDITYLDSIDPKAYVTRSTTDPLAEGTLVRWANWRVTRDTYMYFENFGSKSNESRPGRYSATVLGRSEGFQKSGTEAGVRCAVRINEGRP
ncbi:fibronectin type III domain protein [Bacteriovorax sp. BSW11_IV]|uniref:fibronectin type III domain-containing protein n=1 Tax=Bacteriovorax sp. BSW11_IV TaxID=1353529 RepID=UPI00038A48E7|nr:fibronectin type III domain-containing protein [Bacteriovorax sp. BSW11_IV]EQC45235.1 fibronectin type III domain protein [Bacteriovorax sp. BSW11_IV]